MPPLGMLVMTVGEIARRVDQHYVRERLWKVAEQSATDGIVLLRQHAEVVAQADEPFEHLHRFIMTSLQVIVVRQPERARDEHAFTFGQTVDFLSRAIAADEAVV